MTSDHKEFEIYIPNDSKGSIYLHKLDKGAEETYLIIYSGRRVIKFYESTLNLLSILIRVL